MYPLKNRCVALLENLAQNRRLDNREYITLLKNRKIIFHELSALAQKTAQQHFGKGIFLRGLIEISNYCRNDCYYCGIRRSNRKLNRYRLNEKEILEIINEGYALGFRTFVLQGGEDGVLTDEFLIPLLKKIRRTAPEAAITLSLGERSHTSYKRLHDAGADRYLLRHETINRAHYERLHPEKMHWENRLRCLEDLYHLGYQAGAGFMVGSPYQTLENLAEDLVFLQEYRPHMVGIGPFLPQKDTPFGKFPPGDLQLTLTLLGLIRLMLPKTNLPATTALATLSQTGHLDGIRMGANVIMPNLSPLSVRKDYSLYDDKASFGSESVEGLELLKKELSTIGYYPDFSRGDHEDFRKEIGHVQ